MKSDAQPFKDYVVVDVRDDDFLVCLRLIVKLQI
jgi:hypothetical protein